METKREKEIKFHTADYDYMDDMPLEGWIWEFMRRSEEHKQYWIAYKEMERRHNENEISSAEVSEFRERRWFIRADQGTWLYQFYFSEKDPLQKWDNKKDSHKAPMYRCLDGISKSYPVDVINLKWFLNPDGSLIAHKDDNRAMYPLVTRDPIEKLGLYIDNERIVMALIDISAPMRSDEIAELLKAELVRWRKVLKVHVRDAKTPKTNPNKLLKQARIWKSYIIIYDLVQKCLSDAEKAASKDVCYKKIRNMLFDYDESYNTEKTIERHYKAAEKLINGGYKKYL